MRACAHSDAAAAAHAAATADTAAGKGRAAMPHATYHATTPSPRPSLNRARCALSSPPAAPPPLPAQAPTPEHKCAKDCYVGSPCLDPVSCCQDSVGVCYDAQAATPGSLPSLKKEGRAVGCPATVTGGYEGFCFCSVRTDFCAPTKPPAPTPPAPTPPAPTPTPAQR